MSLAGSRGPGSGGSRRLGIAGLGSFLAFGLAACTAVPPPQEWFREESRPAAVGELLPLAPPADIEGLGWEEALRLAFERSPTLEVARRRIRRAEALLREAKALVYPRLDLRGSYVRFLEAADFRGRTGTDVSGSETRTRFFTRGGSDIYSAGVDATYPLFDGGNAYYAREAARSSLDAEREDARAVRRDLELAVTETFLDVILSAGTIRIAEEALGFTEAEEERARSRAEVGEGLQVDALRFATRASEDRLALNQARAERRVRIAALSELLGTELDEDVEFVVPDEELSLPDAVGIDTALENRPELRALRARREAAEADLSRELGSWWPVVNAFGSYGLLTIDSLEIGSDNDELQVGAALSMNLFEGGATAARVASLREEAKRIAADERELALEIRRELAEAQSDLRLARENVEVSRETVELAEEVLERVTAQYRAGEANVIDVTEAELQRTRAQLAHLRSRVNLLRFQARLRRALGLVAGPEVSP